MRASLAALLALALPVMAAAQTAAKAPAEGAAATAPPAQPVAQQVPEASLAEVVGDAGAAEAQLRRLETDLVPDAATEALVATAPEAIAQIEERAEAAKQRIEQATQLRQLADMENRWLAEQERVEGWRGQTTGRALAIGESLARVDELTAVWEKTRQKANQLKAPSAVLDRIGRTLQAAQTTRDKITAMRAETLELQADIGGVLGVVADVLERTKSAKQAIRGGLLGTDSLPIWAALAAREDLGDILERAVAERRADFAATWEYMVDSASSIALHGVLLLMAVAAMLAMRPRALRWLEEDEDARPSAQLLARPFASGTLIAVLAWPMLYQNEPSSFEALLLLTALLMSMRLLPILLEPQIRPAFYGLAVFFVIDRFREALVGTPLLSRMLFEVELLGMLAMIGFLLGKPRLRLLPRAELRLPIFLFVRRVAILLVVVAFASSVLGYVALSRVVGNGVLRTAYTGVAIYASYKVLVGTISVFMRGGAFRRIRVIDLHRASVTQRSLWTLRLCAFLGWVYVSLGLFGIRDELSAFGGGLLSSPLSVGQLEVSLSDVLSFIVAILVAVYASRFVRYVLDEDVLPRLNLPRGVDYAISTSAFYVVLMVGFFAAVAAAGMDLSRFTILAGALGVGIGFGLQNVVNNFVSGLILLFERPIKTGDTIEVGPLVGEVRVIGIRASTVRTWQGAEVIVPNADLIAGQVINWTLSDRNRRIDVDVGVKYGTDPERVLELLLGVARADDRILEWPEPSALFRGFGDSSLDFRLRAWTSHYEEWVRIHSDLNVAVNRALADAEIEIPFPQRDLHLRSVDEDLRRPLREDEPARAPAGFARSQPPEGARDSD